MNARVVCVRAWFGENTKSMSRMQLVYCQKFPIVCLFLGRSDLFLEIDANMLILITKVGLSGLTLVTNAE